MDDPGSLVSDLLRKLGELDDKVVAYRADRAAEFARHSDDILRDVPRSVAAEVHQALRASISRFPSLYPNGTMASGEEPESPAIDLGLWDGRGPSPPPVLHHTSGIPTASTSGTGGPVSGPTPRALGSSPKDRPRDPHAREQEFHGLFTPSYLPLLDGSERPAPASPTRASKDSPVTHSQRLLSADDSGRAPLSTSPHASASDSGVVGASGSGEMVPRFPPVRRFTDPSADLGGGRETRVRRSALRRSSSSSNRASPGSSRRVRFDFEGEEVLPTSSPQATTATAVALPPADFRTAITASASASATPALYDSPPAPKTSPSVSLLDDEDEYSPPPKKVSSSQALRALSKLPLEDPSTWTVVNASPDVAEPFLRSTRPPTQPPSAVVPTKTGPPSIPSPPDVEEFENQPASSAQNILGSPLQDLEAYDDDDDGSSSEDEFISMPMRPARKPSLSPVSQSPKPSNSPIQGTKPNPYFSMPASETGLLLQQKGDSGPTTSAQDSSKFPSPAIKKANGIPGKSPNQSAQAEASSTNVQSSHRDDDEEDLFDLDEDTKSGSKPRPYLEEDEEEESDGEAEGDADAAESTTTTGTAATSMHSNFLPAGRPVAQPSSPAPVVSVIGSFKGRQITFDVVKDPLVHQKAAELGNFNSFVGSVDGRSGVDHVDPSSYRGTSLSRADLFSGTPRSLTERMILEEVAEEDGFPTIR